MKVKAAVVYEFGKPLVMEEVELDPVGKNDVRLKLAATAICHTDVHAVKGEHGIAPLPGIAGHEMCAWVEEVGEAVTYLKPGDLVAASIMASGCGQCYYCMMGIPGKCLNHPMGLQVPGRFVNKDGKRLTQLCGRVAGFAEYAVVPEWHCVKVPPDFRVDLAAMLSCGVVSGYGAVLYRAKVPPNASVTVMGTGGVGLNAIQGARFVGAYPIIAVDVVDRKLEMAKEFGASHTINARTKPDLIQKINELTYGRGSDYVIVASAGIEILRQAWNASAAAGTTVIVGHGYEEQMSDWHPVEFCRGRTITGSALGVVRLRLDIPRLIELYQAGRFKLDELVTGHYSFDQINEALDDMAKGDAIRNVVMF
jgi:S-(hydroxymethyl)glutathione dehydrogenase / alcohol dehydrogenase